MSTPKLIEGANIFHVTESVANGNADDGELVVAHLKGFLTKVTNNSVDAGVDIAAPNLFGVIKHPKNVFANETVKLGYIIQKIKHSNHFLSSLYYYILADSQGKSSGIL